MKEVDCLDILLTNDDGISALGIQALREILEPIATVYVVAPERERSATGHAITMHKPLHAKEIEYGPNCRGWRVNGTPADCAKLGIEALLPRKPDLLLSGINHGANLGRDIFYSGTVSAAMEGVFLGVPSIALSLDQGRPTDIPWVAQFVRWWITCSAFVMPPMGILYNVNFPSLRTGLPPSAMVQVRLGHREYSNDFHRRLDPRGQEYFWLAGKPKDDIEDPDTDVGAIARGKVTMTPLNLDVTAHHLLDTAAWEIPPEFN